ncbi:MAG: Fis family transcriptional regulator [Proteobacteria bacterium]|nr:Fis family transcriptional regulator [Pseudomonadota bacterium]
MDKRDAWINVFPVPRTSSAVDVMTEAWNEMSNRYKPKFNHGTNEPNLTFVLGEYIRDVVAERRKLLGNWTVEGQRGKINFTTGEILKRTRTDIEYHWNSKMKNYSVVFEFKKLDHHSRSRKHYYGESGMLRFITGSYSIGHPLAFMVGILVDDRDECIKSLRSCLQHEGIVGELQMCSSNNQLLRTPLLLFPNHAEFDTEHLRDRDKAPKHGTIRISHLFLSFGYPSDSRDQRKKRKESLAEPVL